MLDARAKVVSLGALLIAVSLARSYETLASVLLLSLGLAVISKLSPWGFIRKAWLTIPAFTALMALPAVLNWVVPGHDWIVLGQTPAFLTGAPWHLPPGVSITHEGIFAVGRIVLRVAASVSLCLLVTAATPWVQILKALSALGIPSAFILVLSMTYRYIFLLVKTVEEMHLALMSRSLRQPRKETAHAWISSRVGHLLMRTHALAGDVHLAMRSRGYLGDVRLLESPAFRFRDAITIMIALGLAVTLIVLEHKALA